LKAAAGSSPRLIPATQTDAATIVESYVNGDLRFEATLRAMADQW
jgi:hypothetical protein